MKKRKKKVAETTRLEDYLKAVRKADREIQQSINPGWISTHKIHPSKKTYNRRDNKRMEE